MSSAPPSTALPIGLSLGALTWGSLTPRSPGGASALAPGRGMMQLGTAGLRSGVASGGGPGCARAEFFAENGFRRTLQGHWEEVPPETEPVDIVPGPA